MKKLSLLSSIFVITLFLASCGGSEDKKDGGSEDKKGVVDPVTVTDADGDGIVDDDDDCDSSREGFKSNDNTDYDGDGCEDDSTEDTDDDNDEVDDGDDECQTSINSNFVSVSTSPGTINDYDGDGCEDDSTEDTDDDNDKVDDGDDECQTSINSNFVSVSTSPGTINDYDGDGCEDDSTEDTDDDNDEVDDGDDECQTSINSNFVSVSTSPGTINDYDGDGCEDDSTEDTDDDNDEVDDDDDECQISINSNFVSVSTSPGTINDYDGDGCEDDSTEDTDDDNDEVDDDDDRCQTSINSNFVSVSTSPGTINDYDGDGCEDAGEDKDDDDDGLIEIATAKQLNKIRYRLDGTLYDEEELDGSGYEGSNTGCPTAGCNGYELINDIYLADPVGTATGNFEPVGFLSSPFTAIFEGNGNTISNLIISNGTRYVGFFGILGADSEVRNLSFAKSATGAGSVTSVNIASSNTDSGRVGTLAGKNEGTISNVSTDISVSVDLDTLVTGSKQVGGLVGESNGIIQNSRATGNVSGGNGNDDVGGLVGYAAFGASIRNSYTTNSVSGSSGGDNVGGLVGNASYVINNSYTIGSVNGDGGDDKVGGLVGIGLVSITNSYSIATVDGGDGTDIVGRLATPSLSTFSVNNSYYDGDSNLTGETVQTFGIGKTKAQLKVITPDIPTTDSACNAVGGTFSSNICDDGNLDSWSTYDFNFTDGKYPSLKSYETTTDTSTNPPTVTQVTGSLLCGQLPEADFVQCGSAPPTPPVTSTDADTDGIADDIDVDDDNNGLIELTATTLTNIRYQLDGTTYKINASDTGSTMGCSTVDPIGCNGYEITNDIDLVGNFEPVAGNFTAIFDGNNNTINDLTIDNSTQYTGFFTTVASAGEVRSINFVGGSITSSFGNYGYVGVLAGKNEGTVSDISANLSVSSVGAGPNNNTGGLIGENSGILQDSQSSGNISGGTGDSDKVGGLVGSNNGGTIQNSRATGNASGGTGNGDSVGGLVGANKSSSSIRNSYAIGSAKGNAGNGDSVGGLVGTNTGGSIQNSYAIGSANGGDGDDYVGGLVGLIIQGTIQNNYALGDVDGGNGATSDSVGRLIGGEQLSTISGNYFDENSGLIGKEEETFVASKALGKTSDQLKAINNVAPTTDTTCTSAGGTWDGTACTNGHLDFNTNNWDFTADKYPSLKSYKEDASDTQIAGTLLCNQPTDFVQCTP